MKEKLRVPAPFRLEYTRSFTPYFNKLIINALILNQTLKRILSPIRKELRATTYRFSKCTHGV